MSVFAATFDTASQAVAQLQLRGLQEHRAPLTRAHINARIGFVNSVEHHAAVLEYITAGAQLSTVHAALLFGVSHGYILAEIQYGGRIGASAALKATLVEVRHFYAEAEVRTRNGRPLSPFARPFPQRPLAEILAGLHATAPEPIDAVLARAFAPIRAALPLELQSVHDDFHASGELRVATRLYLNDGCTLPNAHAALYYSRTLRYGGAENLFLARIGSPALHAAHVRMRELYRVGADAPAPTHVQVSASPVASGRCCVSRRQRPTLSPRAALTCLPLLLCPLLLSGDVRVTRGPSCVDAPHTPHAHVTCRC